RSPRARSARVADVGGDIVAARHRSHHNPPGRRSGDRVSTHLYCVLPRATRGAMPSGLTGVNGARVRVLPLTSVVAWVSDVGPVQTSNVELVRNQLTYGAVRAH